MQTLTKTLLVFAFLLAVAYTASIQTAEQKKVSIYTGIGIDEVERTVDITKPNVVREQSKLTATNAGEQAVNSIFLALPKATVENNLALLEAVISSTKQDLTNQGFENKMQKEAVFFEVKLIKALQPNERVSITVNTVLINALTPYPKQIRQRENQKLLYVNNANFYTPYSVKSQKTTYQLGTTSIESYTESVKPVDRRGTNIVYGTFYDQKPFSQQEVKLHYQNNSPSVVITNLERIIEISHWGNLAVEEHYNLRHAGADLKGTFSRLDYQRNPAQSSPASFRTLTAKLPIDAADIYYRDRIGNISTSDCRPSVDKKYLEVDFQPRFPMFGGWKVKFYIGYNLPLNNYETIDGDLFTLATTFGTPFDFAPIEDLTVKIIVPEGAKNIVAEVPFPIDSESREVMKTYLDTFGRTVIIIKKKNVVNEHNQIFKVKYNFSPVGLLQEPALVIGALFIFCITVMIYTRLDMSITKTESDLKQENETRVVELLESYTELQVERETLYRKMESSIKKGNNEEFKSLKAKRVNAKNQIKDQIQSELATLNAKECISKVNAIEKKDDEKLQLLEDILGVVQTKPKNLEQKISELEEVYNSKSEEINDLIEQLNI